MGGQPGMIDICDFLAIAVLLVGEAKVLPEMTAVLNACKKVTGPMKVATAIASTDAVGELQVR